MGPCRRLCAAAVVLAVMACLPLKPAQAADTMTVVLDRAQIVKLPDRAVTLVIGNPLIADVSIQAGGTMVITGKGYGATNIIVLDRAGATLMNTSVTVIGPRDETVVVYRGVERESYSCAPKCERRITLGDTAPFFEATMGQTGARNSQAAAGGAAQSR